MMLRWVVLSFFAAFYYCATSVAAQPANLAAIDVRQMGSWEAGLHRNNTSMRFFCAAATYSKTGTLFRINAYRDTNETFLEVYNKNWTYRQGEMRFSVEFDRSVGMDFRGKSFGDSLTYDLIDIKMTQALLGMLAVHRQFHLINANSTRIDLFSLFGAKEAVRQYAECQSR